MKKCPYCAEEIQDEAIVCRYCGRDLKPVAKPAPKVSRKGSPVLLGVVAIVLISAFIWFMTRSGSPNTPSGPTTTEAALVCKDFVSERLRAPFTAEFESAYRADVDQNGYNFTVNSYVSSENGFGAMVRTDYVCVVKYTGNGNYSLVSLTTSP